MSSEQPSHPSHQPLSSPRYVSQLYVIPAVDAAEAGKGQLEISVNQGQVPNNVQMQGKEFKVKISYILYNRHHFTYFRCRPLLGHLHSATCRQ